MQTCGILIPPLCCFVLAWGASPPVLHHRENTRPESAPSERGEEQPGAERFCAETRSGMRCFVEHGEGLDGASAQPQTSLPQNNSICVVYIDLFSRLA